MKFFLSKKLKTSIQEQLIEQIKFWIEKGDGAPGVKLPSIRRLAESYKISRFTVIEAYDCLVALGYLESKHGSGFYVADNLLLKSKSKRLSLQDHSHTLINPAWGLFREPSDALKLGCGWLPKEWRPIEEMSYAIRQVTRKDKYSLIDHTAPLGNLELRKHIQIRLEKIKIDTELAQILLTSSASQALDLVVRCLLKPGDTVFVETPGYHNLFSLLKLHHINMIAIPRNWDGPDIPSLKKQLKKDKPKLFFVNSVFQNPTGTTILPPIAFEILQLATQYQFLIVEDDIYADFQDGSIPRLATLDQLKNIIYLGSFSKTISCSLRVGYIAAATDIIKNLVDIKMITNLGGSAFSEAVILTMIENGSYHKFLEQLRKKLRLAMTKAIKLLKDSGWNIFHEPSGGMFIWVSHPKFKDAKNLVEFAKKQGVLLSYGSSFYPDDQKGSYPWLRLNIGYIYDIKTRTFLMTIDNH